MYVEERGQGVEEYRGVSIRGVEEQKSKEVDDIGVLGGVEE